MFTVESDDGSMYNYNLSKTIITKSCVVGQTSKLDCGKNEKKKDRMMMERFSLIILIDNYDLH